MMKLLIFSVVCLGVLLAAAPCRAARLHDDMWGFDYPLALNGFSLSYVTDDIRHYQYMQFPVYIGYITLGKDRSFTFTRETDHPIELLEKKLKNIETTGEVPIYYDRLVLYPEGKNTVNIREKEFTEELTWLLRDAEVEIIALLEQGEAHNHTYSFKEHCVYDVDDFDRCKNIKSYFANTITHKKHP